jgi:hypothetical protein
MLKQILILVAYLLIFGDNMVGLVGSSRFLSNVLDQFSDLTKIKLPHHQT